MPTYDYRCKACNHEFELFQSMSDPVKKKGPACGKSALERLIGTGAALVFKGSGFYQTDYRSESYKQAAKAESGGGGSDGGVKGAGESKGGSNTEASDSKPAASKREADATAPRTPPSAKVEPSKPAAKTGSGTDASRAKTQK
jgi:putative FmdB family regulatory protein